jgi:hypothetical protein
MNPLEGQPLVLAAAKASVGPALLPDLVEHVQAGLGPRLDEYRREYERALATDAYEAFFVPEGHWAALAGEFDLGPRERDAVRRAHEEQLLSAGGDRDRRAEFDTALELREVVVIGSG